MAMQLQGRLKYEVYFSHMMAASNIVWGNGVKGCRKVRTIHRFLWSHHELDWSSHLLHSWKACESLLHTNIFMTLATQSKNINHYHCWQYEIDRFDLPVGPRAYLRNVGEVAIVSVAIFFSLFAVGFTSRERSLNERSLSEPLEVARVSLPLLDADVNVLLEALLVNLLVEATPEKELECWNDFPPAKLFTELLRLIDLAAGEAQSASSRSLVFVDERLRFRELLPCSTFDEGGCIKGCLTVIALPEDWPLLL